MVGQNKRCLDLQDVVFAPRVNFLLQNALKSETCTLSPESNRDQLLNSHVDTFHMPNNPKLTLEKLKGARAIRIKKTERSIIMIETRSLMQSRLGSWSNELELTKLRFPAMMFHPIYFEMAPSPMSTSEWLDPFSSLDTATDSQARRSPAGTAISWESQGGTIKIVACGHCPIRRPT